MRRYRLFAAVALIVLPSILGSSPVRSNSMMPWINNAAGPISQPNCPTGSQNGCFAPVNPTGSYGNPYAANPNYSMVAPFSGCMQFMQAFLRMGANFESN